LDTCLRPLPDRPDGKRTGSRNDPALAFCRDEHAAGGSRSPLTTYVPPLYAAIFGFNLATIGAIFLFARLWDALIDPAIGVLSDRTRTRWGRRRPWIAVGSVIFGAGSVATFLPRQADRSRSLAIFTLYLGYSMITTPLAAWTGEFSAQYHERTRTTTYAMVMTARAAAGARPAQPAGQPPCRATGRTACRDGRDGLRPAGHHHSARPWGRRRTRPRVGYRAAGAAA
jgi:hypothetical protein